MSNPAFPPVPDIFERDPVNLFKTEFRHNELMARIVTKMSGLLISRCVVDPEELSRLQGVEGPVVLAGTHEGVADIPVLSAVGIQGGLGEIRMVSKAENFYSDSNSMPKRVAMQFGGYMNRRLGAYPIDKYLKNAAWLKLFLKLSHYVLTEEQKTHGIFPTGSRSSDEVLPGALRIANSAGVPIVMVGIHGTSDDIKKLRKLRRPKIAVAISQPVYVGRKDIDLLQTLHDEQKQRAIELHERVYGNKE